MSKLLLKTFQLTKSFGDHDILCNLSLEIREGDHIGFIGANGCGKSTLLSLLSGDLAPDAGRVERHGTVSYLRQFGGGDARDSTGVWRTAGVRSGGEQTRLRIAGALGHGAHLYLADEPSANLDANGRRLLSDMFREIPTFVLVSHDRGLLDLACQRIWELRDGTITEYNGNFTEYQRQSAERRARQQTEYERYHEERQRLQHIFEEKQRRAAAVARPNGRDDPREMRLRDFLSTRKSTDTSQRSLARAARSIQARIDRLEVKAKPKDPPRAVFDFRLTHPPENKIILSAEHLRFTYPGSDTPILRDVSFNLPRSSRTLLHGKNGSGKTTLLNLIYQYRPGVLPEGASGEVYRVPKANIGFFRQGFDSLDWDKTILENVMDGAVQSEASARSILARMLFHAPDIGKKAGTCSGGERIRLAFAKMFASPANVLFLDEPTNFLDLPSIEALQGMLLQYEGTILFVSHDRVFADALSTSALFLDNGVLTAFDGNVTQMEARRAAPPPADELSVLEMRLAEVVGKLSMRRFAKEKQTLEQQYDSLAAQIKRIKEEVR